MISDRSAQLDSATGHQLVVVTLNSLNGHSIDDYGLHLGNYWGIGRKEHDDGVLLIVAPNERNVRIEVGQGLESELTNEEAQEIVDYDLLPSFRKNEFVAGIEAGVEAIIDQIEPENGSQ